MAFDEFSCIKDVVKAVRISLPLSYSNNQASGVSDVLEGWKSQYHSELGGIVVGYKNVSLVNSLAKVVNDNPYLHYVVKAQFSVFRPAAGSILKGRINRMSREHVGCIVHDCINASIQLSPTVADEISGFLALDNEVVFQVTHLDAQRKVVRVKGEITPKCIELMQEMYPEYRKGVHTFFNDEGGDPVSSDDAKTEHSSEERTNGLSEVAEKSRKKKQQKNITNENLQDNIFSFLQTSLASLNDGNKGVNGKVASFQGHIIKHDNNTKKTNASISLIENHVAAPENSGLSSITKINDDAFDLLNYHNLNDMHKKGTKRTADDTEVPEAKRPKTELKANKNKKSDKKEKKNNEKKSKKDSSKQKKSGCEKVKKNKKDKAKKLKDKIKSKKDKVKKKVKDKKNKKDKKLSVNSVLQPEIKQEV